MSRDSLAEMLMGLVDGARTLREMREAEALCEELMAEHGRHFLVVGAVEELSRRILYEEVGEQGEEMNETQYRGTPGPQVPTGSVGQDMRRMIERHRAAPLVLTGMREDGTYLVAGEDEVRRLAGHVMKKKEQAIEFFARTGLSLAQMRTMSRGEITRFVEQAERNNLEQQGVRKAPVVEPTGQRDWNAPKPQPSALLVPDYSANDD